MNDILNNINNLFNNNLDYNSLYYYDYKLINFLNDNRLSNNNINIIINSFRNGLTYENFLKLSDFELNMLNINIGPKIFIRKIIDIENNKLNQKYFSYLDEFDIYEILREYKIIFYNNNITIDIFLELNNYDLILLDIPKGPRILILNIIYYLKN